MKRPNYPLRTFILLAAALGHITTATVSAQTPYPPADDELAWPGAGPIRVFPWMTDNRNYFWSQRDKAQGSVVLVGDSLLGNWKEVSKVPAFANLTVANRGIGGDVTRGALFRFQEDVLDLSPRAVVILVGTNDLSAHADPATVAGNLSLMLDQAREHNASMLVILCTLPPRASPQAPLKSPDALTDLNARIQDLGGSRESVTVLDLYEPFATAEGVPNPEYFQKDLLHFSAAGHARLGELLGPALEKAGVK